MNKVIIFSAPSGSGKTTLVKYALGQFPQLEFSISCTTRSPRGEEINGKDYYFLSPEAFKTKIQEGAFVEYEEVYTDKFYGTLKAEVERIWARHNIVIFDVDVKGGIALKNYFGSQAMSVFIMPPSVAELERRLIARGTDDRATIATRVAKAEEELSYQNQFDQVVINEDLATAQATLHSLITAFIAS